MPIIRGERIPLQVPHRRFWSPAELAAEERRGVLVANEPESCRRDLARFLPILAQLGLNYAVFRVFRLEDRAFRAVVAIALAALPVHYALPYRWKKPTFVAVSIAALAYVFGPAVTAWVLLFSALFIGICYLPIAWIARVVLIGVLAAVCACGRADRLAGLVPPAAWPLLASVFMFRMLIYLYEWRHARRSEPLFDALCYFFLLPNWCFLHFPVVDYRTLQRGYFARDIHAIQQSGLRMMFAGTVHLLLYRLVYHALMIPSEEVENLASLGRYLVCNYLLYLRVSGQFHIACGLLHLFGFDLPETHHHYLLASGFTDYWRRINIYWKDFMVRIVFNPIVFRLKRWPQPAALAVATIAVFGATWGLHAYQSFWLRGEWGFGVPDALFWGTLGLLVLVNVQLDARRPRGRSQGRRPKSLVALARRTLQTLATLTVIVLLWSLWSSPSVGNWLNLLRRGLRV